MVQTASPLAVIFCLQNTLFANCQLNSHPPSAPAHPRLYSGTKLTEGARVECDCSIGPSFWFATKVASFFLSSKSNKWVEGNQIR